MAPENAITRPWRLQDLTGRIFGRLEVICFAGIRSRTYYWQCVCECGERKIVDGWKLRSGSTQSCGCYKRDAAISRYVIDIAGRRFGRLVALKYAHNKMWACQCDCGETKLIRSYSLLTGDTTSCGCFHRETAGLRHGMRHLPEYGVWVSMRNRCFRNGVKGYENYGGRGITVCDRWNDPKNGFVAFIQDMGRRPSNRHTIERRNVNGNYCPQNCEWATHIVQGRNRRNNRIIEYKGQRKCLSAWAIEAKISSGCLSNRLRKGWAFGDAIAPENSI